MRLPQQPAIDDPLVKKFQQETNLTLGKRIYSGDGDIYQLKDHPNKVVKIVWCYTASICPKRVKLLEDLQKINNASVVRIHKVGSFTTDITADTGTADHYYYYVMDKLSLIPRRGRRSQVTHIAIALEEEAPVPSKATNRVKYFIRNARRLPYSYEDIHEWNIMATKRGSFKFVDLESFMFSI